MAGLNSFGVVPYSSFSFFFPEVIRNLELYRLVTGFLVPNPQPMQGLMEVYMLYTFSNGVETKKFSRNLPDYFFYLTITFPVMLFGAYFFLPPVISLSPALMSALTYTWAIANYDQKVNFYFVPLKASLLPIVSLGFRLLVDGQISFLLALIGMSAAYLYNCTETHSFGPLASFFWPSKEITQTDLETALLVGCIPQENYRHLNGWEIFSQRWQASITVQHRSTMESMLHLDINVAHQVADLQEERVLFTEREEDLEQRRNNCTYIFMYI